MDLLNGKLSRRTAATRILTIGAAGVIAGSLAQAAPQPHMEAALKALQNAAAELQKAADDKKGHREQAIKMVSNAILQVQQGIQAGTA